MGKRSKAGRGSRGVLSSGSSSWLVGVTVAVVMVVIGGWFLMSGSGMNVPAGITLPSYVLSSPAGVQEAYIYAVEHPEVLQHIPCYCGCGDPRFGHESNWNCFVQSMAGSSVVYDPHGYT
jgi:hypothetical protein